MRKAHIGILLIVIAMAGLFIFSTFSDSQASTERIEKLIDTTIPDNATDIQSQFNWGSQADSFFIQFALPAADLEAFTADLCNSQSIHLTGEYNTFAKPLPSAAPGWWPSDLLQTAAGGQCSPDQGVTVEIFVNQRDLSLYKVYIVGSTA